MKKNLLFTIPMIIVAVLLFMLRATGIKVHIALSVLGLVILLLYALATKKDCILRKIGKNSVGLQNIPHTHYGRNR
jgi:hypothetical protein